MIFAYAGEFSAALISFVFATLIAYFLTLTLTMVLRDEDPSKSTFCRDYVVLLIAISTVPAILLLVCFINVFIINKAEYLVLAEPLDEFVPWLWINIGVYVLGMIVVGIAILRRARS